MFEKLELTRMAQSLASHAGARLGVVAGNIAHADTPGYKARDLPAFADSYSDADPMRATKPGHIGSPDAATTQARIIRTPDSPNGNSVSLETEMVRGVAVRQQHEMALAIYRNTSEIVRASLGRRG